VVVGVDLAEVDPFSNENVIAIQGDLEDTKVCERVLEALGGAPADVVLCDAAPKLTGVRDVDRAAEERLLEAVEGLLPRLLRPGGDLLLKILEGPEAQQVDRRIRQGFGRAKTAKSQATRKGSSERYLVARDYRPPVD
jgi:23S rRNA (uridine2552-2'-O)-methyltransferase